MAAKTLYSVVVADDEDELREAVCTMIPWEDYGFRLVGSASNGLDALQLVEKHEPDLLLTDIRMPFISGIELARQVREVRPATNIAFLSGYDDFEYAKQAIQYNIISYMLKPLTMEGLCKELRIIHQKIDAQFAMFRQASPGPRGMDLRTAMLMPLVLDGFSRAYLDSVGSETLDGQETLRADFSMTLGGETLGGTVWFEDSGAPVYAEVCENGKIIAAAEFTNFVFDDILPPSTQN